MKPIAIDLFAGAGFMGLGFGQAGFDVRAAVEINPDHVAAHQRNFPNTKVLCRSVIGLHKAEIFIAGGIPKGTDVDLIFGGSPCQSFSVQGHNRADDPRRSLAHEFIRIVGEVRPKHFVFENVKGLTQGENRAVLDQLINEFYIAGYDCSPWQVLNAKHYGVSQSRERLFLLGSRRDQSLIPYPEPFDYLVTAKDVLGDLEDRETAMKLTGWEITQHSPEVIARFAATEPGKRDRISRFYRLHPDGQSVTLTAGTATGSGKGGRHTAKRPIHYKFDRVCTIGELRALHGIPGWVQLGNPVDSICNSAMQIGNSVPPPLACAVAGEVFKTLAKNEAWRISDDFRKSTGSTQSSFSRVG